MRYLDDPEQVRLAELREDLRRTAHANNDEIRLAKRDQAEEEGSGQRSSSAQSEGWKAQPSHHEHKEKGTPA